jgi:pimeloyl-ACP methyl ester carboxylesterase
MILKKLHVLSTVALVVLTFSIIIPLAEAPRRVSQICPPHRDSCETKPLLKSAYRLENNGWIFVHLEGTPFQIGFQHGYLLATETDLSWRAAIHVWWSEEEFGDWWYVARDIAKQYVWRKVPAEQKVEIAGIVAGLRAAGYDWDMWDVTAFNAWADIDAYWDAYFEKERASGHIPLPQLEKGCSAFIATGNATKNGEIVIAHNTWAGYAGDIYWNVIFHIEPRRGNEILYQSSGGCIWSGQDWIMNDAGLMACETTLPDMYVYDITGIPIFVRERHAMQYADNIDDWIEIMTYKGNGAYANEWLVGDAKTGEICSLQLGCNNWNIERTFNGFIGSSNYPKGDGVRSETAYNWTDPTTSGYCRYQRWEQLRDIHYGDIDVELGKAMLADHYDTLLDAWNASGRTLCGHGEVEPEWDYDPSGAYDGKVTSSSLAYPNLGMWGRWGHPCGTEFIVDDFLEAHPEYSWQLPYLRDLSRNDWALFNKEGPRAPAEWNLVGERGVKAYPDLREYVWETDRPPYGPYDKIGLRRLVKAGIEPQGVVFILPGTWSSGEQLISNPPEDWWIAYENRSIALYLANRNFDVYAIDYRTHFVPMILEPDQLSFMADWGWDEWISDIKEAVDIAKEVSGAERVHMAGESFGGSAAMNYASLYWEEDLKGIILLDGGSGAKYPELVDNEYNLTAAIAGMIESGAWSNEVGGAPGSIFIMQYADENPTAPAVNPWTNQTLQPATNPFTNETWTNIAEWAAYMIYIAWGPGAVSNIYEGYGDPSVMIHIDATFDRYWPTRLSLESAALADWDNCPYVAYDFDDHYSEVDVPLLGFTSELFGLAYWGPFRHGIANPDFTGHYLGRYGHLDVYSGEFSETDVSVPTYEWLTSHRMLLGRGRIRIDHDRHWGEATIYVNATVIDFKVDGVRVSWNIVYHRTHKNLEVYKGKSELGCISVLITHKGHSVAVGPKVFFLGQLI